MICLLLGANSNLPGHLYPSPDHPWSYMREGGVWWLWREMVVSTGAAVTDSVCARVCVLPVVVCVLLVTTTCILAAGVVAALLSGPLCAVPYKPRYPVSAHCVCVRDGRVGGDMFMCSRWCPAQVICVLHTNLWLTAMLWLTALLVVVVLTCSSGVYPGARDDIMCDLTQELSITVTVKLSGANIHSLVVVWVAMTAGADIAWQQCPATMGRLDVVLCPTHPACGPMARCACGMTWRNMR